jgi:hypothetical protein
MAKNTAHFLDRFIDETISFSHPLFVLESFHGIMILSHSYFQEITLQLRAVLYSFAAI